MPGSPLPDTRICCPSSIPAGIETLIFTCFFSFPVPPHVVHLSSIISPVPLTKWQYTSIYYFAKRRCSVPDLIDQTHDNGNMSFSLFLVLPLNHDMYHILHLLESIFLFPCQIQLLQNPMSSYIVGLHLAEAHLDSFCRPTEKHIEYIAKPEKSCAPPPNPPFCVPA